MSSFADQAQQAALIARLYRLEQQVQDLLARLEVLEARRGPGRPPKEAA